MIISRNQKGVLYTRTSAMRDEQIKVKSLGKAMRILECFIGRGELGVTEISSMLGLGKSNVHDILSTFITLGYCGGTNYLCRPHALIENFAV